MSCRPARQTLLPFIAIFTALSPLFSFPLLLLLELVLDESFLIYTFILHKTSCHSIIASVHASPYHAESGDDEVTDAHLARERERTQNGEREEERK